MATKTGSCSCGALQYELAGEPLFTHACHCTLCQRRTGSAFGLSMIIESRQFNLISGIPASVEIISDSGNKKYNYFCPQCGTVIYGDSPALPGLCIIRPGTLDDTSWVTVQAHIWTRSKQTWLKLPDDIPCFEKMYDRDEVWPQDSLQRLNAIMNK